VFNTRGILPTIALIGCLGSCTINPVTGERELALVSAEDEIAIGRAQYLPSRQMQGGDFVVDPALTRYVSQVGQRIGAVSDRALPYEFVVLNSSVPNAWALPGGKIAVNRGLLVELQSEAELAAVLGHEIVHAAARHGARAMQRGMLLQGALLVTTVAMGDGNYSNLAVGAAGLGAQLINLRHGRDAELEADAYGMQYISRTGYDTQAAVSLQETFLRLSQQRSEQGWLAGLFASHPPSAERVERNRQTAANLPSDGETGRDRYQAAIAQLRQRKPAYDSYDKAHAALEEGRVDEAEALALDAVDLVPGEGHFHALLGDIDFERGRFEDAVGHFRTATTRNDSFFYYHMRKGLAHQRLMQWTDAESDLEASIALLPTADAYFGLGDIAEQRGDRALALRHYRQAAESSSSVGLAAQEAVVRLDLPDNPGNYLMLRTNLDSLRNLRVELANSTRLSVTDIILTIRYIDPQGALQQTQRRWPNQLPPNGVQTSATGLGPFGSTQEYEVTIDSARVVTR